MDEGEGDDVPELPKLPDEFGEITAKSILPEDGFNTRSVMFPTVWPWLFFTSAFINLLALVSCPIRPVGERLV